MSERPQTPDGSDRQPLIWDSPSRPDRVGVAGLRPNEESPLASTPLAAGEESMSVGGVVAKTSGLFAVMFVSASLPWTLAQSGAEVGVFLWGGLIGAMVFASIICVNPVKLARPLAPMYAVMEGASLGALAVMVEQWLPGIARQALELTFAIFLVMLVIHLVVRPARNAAFRRGVMAATSAIVLIYVVDIAMRWLLGSGGFVFLHERSLLTIGACVLILAVAAFNLTIDFEFIQENVQRGAPRDLEWFAAVSLVISLVWVFVESLRLLMMLSSDD
ncbi:MAG TPA: Bax inhibitor-1/YccA family protein [Actinomycetota bacterium]